MRALTLLIAIAVTALALPVIGCQDHKKPAASDIPTVAPDAAVAKTAAPAPPVPKLGGGTVKTADAGVKTANPASKFCRHEGGKLELVQSSAGSAGVCVFADGSRCEEWRYFNCMCKPGACREASGVCEAPVAP